MTRCQFRKFQRTLGYLGFSAALVATYFILFL